MVFSVGTSVGTSHDKKPTNFYMMVSGGNLIIMSIDGLSHDHEEIKLT